MTVKTSVLLCSILVFSTAILAHSEDCHEEIPHDEVPHDDIPHDDVPHDDAPHDDDPHDDCTHDDACEAAYWECDFRFKNHEFSGVPDFKIKNKPTDRPFTPKIVSTVPGEKLGVLNANTVIPEFIFDSGPKPITNFGSQPFTPTQFKPFSKPPSHRKSGIGHETFHGNQLQVARGKCIRVYFSQYQIYNGPKSVTNMNNVPTSKNKCVVFKTH